MTLKKTISTLFLVPTVGVSRETLQDNGMINGYISDKDRESTYPNSVYILFKPPNIDRFKEFVDYEYERKNSALVEDYDPAQKFVVLVYTLNPKFEEDFKLIKLGKYSKTSQKFQALFPKVIKVYKKGEIPKEKTSLYYQIFNKSEELKDYWGERAAIDFKGDMEVWDTWDDENEVLDIERIKELI